MKNLKLARKNSGLTQKEVSMQLGIPSTTYANYEQIETSKPPINTLLKLADMFGCSVDYLLGHETKGIIHLDSFTEPQQKLVNLVSKLNYEQSMFLVGYVSDMLGLPYHSVKPIKPW